MARMTGGEFVAETVHGYGISHVFFMPVIAPRTLMEMEKRGIRRVMTHGEKAAAYMADGYARITRGPGLCMSQSVGAVNLSAGLQDAYLACSPVIAITGRCKELEQHRHAYQEVDHLAPFEAVTKYNVQVTELKQLPLRLRQAFREAMVGCPGPTHLDIEGFIGEGIAEVEGDLEVVREEVFAKLPPFRPEPGDDSVCQVLAALSSAERPVIVAGGGVTASGAREELVAFAEQHSIPVATALNAKTAIPPDHPLSVGVPGEYSRACANRVVFEADLVIFIGSHTGGQVTNHWRIPAPGTRVVQIDIDPAELGRSYPAEVAVQADAAAALGKLLAASDAPRETPHPAWNRRVEEIVQEWREEAAPLRNAETVPMRPERLCRELTNCLPPDAVLVSDTGHAGIWTGTMIDLQHREQSYIRCAGSLGWGFPAALGAKCAVGDRPVICFSGDGGIWYHLTEMETAVRCGIQTVTVVNNNHSLNQEKSVNEDIYGSQTPGSDELWLFEDADFAAIAESMGGMGIRVDRPDRVADAIDRALSSGKPAIVDVKTDIGGIAPPAWAPD